MATSSSPRLCVLMPAFNESANVGAVVRGVLALDLPVQVTVLVVDDGSKDETAKVAREAGAEVISHAVNRGVGAAFRTGIEHAATEGYEYLIHMDSDGQVPPKEIPKLLEPVLSGAADVAVGSRFVREFPENLALWKSLALTTTARVVGALAGYALTDLSCGFRCMNRKGIEAIRPTFDYDYIQETLIQLLAAKLRVVDVPVDILYESEPTKRPSMSARTFRYSSRFLLITGYSMMKLVETRARARRGRSRAPSPPRSGSRA